MKLIHRALLPLAILGLSSFAACGGVGGEQACTDIGCVDGVTLKLPRLASKYMTALPLTVKVCTGAGGSTCVTSTVRAQAGQGPICEAPVMAGVSCIVGGLPELDVEIVVPPSAAEIAAGKLDVHVTVTDAMNMMVFDQTMSGVAIKTSTPNGASCPPTCHQATVAFTP